MTDKPIVAADALAVKTAKTGFYKGFNPVVSLGAKILMVLLIAWAAISPDQAGEILTDVKGFVQTYFGTWYVFIVAFFFVLSFALAIIPATGRVKLGKDGEKPEFSKFSWFSMMFGAGIGIGMLTYSTGEPMSHFTTNPEVIQGLTTSESADNVRMAMKWSIMHWGFTAWSCYAVVGLALSYFSYNRGLPLAIRSGLTPLFGKALEGTLGNIIDIVAVLATIVGIGVTIGYGVTQFSSGIYNATGADWIMNPDGKPSIAAMFLSLAVVMIASTLSALSGVGKGIKWLSNLNMGLSFFLIAFFVIFGATAFAFKAYFIGIWDYLIAIPKMATTVWHDDGTETGKALAKWQGDWTIFYWAWWVAYAPFVGMFLARVSRGRTIREYILGALIVPSMMCFVWFAFVGGTAMNLELTGAANGTIVNADLSSQLFATINVMLSKGLAQLMSVVIVILLLTYLITSADSAVLVINTITSAGNKTGKRTAHIIVWSAIITIMVAVLLLAGGMGVINSAMIIGALPFSLVMFLMAISLIKALFRDRNSQ